MTVRWAAVVSVIVAAMTTSACVPHPPTPPSSIVGMTMAEASPVLPEKATYAVQDISVAVDREPEYKIGQLRSEQWTIVAACSNEPNLRDSTSIGLGVLPSDAMDESVLAQLRDGEFDDAATCVDTHR